MPPMPPPLADDVDCAKGLRNLNIEGLVPFVHEEHGRLGSILRDEVDFDFAFVNGPKHFDGFDFVGSLLLGRRFRLNGPRSLDCGQGRKDA
jgi:hypothetical protein